MWFGFAQANELYFAMPINYDGLETDTIFVYGNPGITGTISSPNGFDAPFTIGADNVTSVVVPSSYDLSVDGQITNNGFVITPDNSSDKVGASYLSREQYTTDTSYLFDASGLGTSYYAAGYTNDIGYNSQLTIVGTADGTTVTITPSATFTNGEAAGTPFSITLNKGQSVIFNSNTDVTGTKVTATDPIAVFSGNQCADVPSGTPYCDHLLTALPSTDHYSTSVVVPKTFGTEGTDSNVMRVVAATDGTVVMYQGAAVGTLNAGDWLELSVGNGGEVTANNGVMVTEYLTGDGNRGGAVSGDPSESWIPGSDDWLSNYVFSTPVGDQAYDTNFLDLVIDPSDIASLLLNGVSVSSGDCSPLAGTSYDTCEISIAAGAGNIKAANPFLLLLDGGSPDDSYFTFAGATFSTGASPPPVPEPATWLLMIAAFAGLGFAVRRRAAA